MKNFLGIVGLVLVVGVITGGNLSQLSDWSNAQLVGFNFFTIMALFGGGYLIYRGLSK